MQKKNNNNNFNFLNNMLKKVFPRIVCIYLLLPCKVILNSSQFSIHIEQHKCVLGYIFKRYW